MQNCRRIKDSGMASLRNIFKLRYNLALCRNWKQGRIVCVRTLFDGRLYKMNIFEEKRNHLLNSLGEKKGVFLHYMRKSLEDGKNIFTSDLRSMILIAKTKDDIEFLMEVTDAYKEQQKNRVFPDHYNCSEDILKMFLINNEINQAYEWFQNQKTTVELEAADCQCFFLMMDMLYKDKRYDDVISLMANVDVYLPRPRTDILTLYFAALYQKNTKTALSQMIGRLGECVHQNIQLPSRCKYFTALLAYNQGDVNSMLELLELPVFPQRYFCKTQCLMLLAYIELGRLEEGLAVLRGLLEIDFKHRLFHDVLQKFHEAVLATDNVDMKHECTYLKRMLSSRDCVSQHSLNEYLEFDIKHLEYNTFLHKDSHNKQACATVLQN